MAFRFRLEKVLRYRSRQVDQRSQVLAAAELEAAGLSRNLALLDREIALLQNRPSAREAALHVPELIAAEIWLRHRRQAREDLAARLAEAQQVCQRRRSELTEAWRDLEVLKGLKKRRKEQWQQENLRRENQELDEIGQIRADRMKREKLSVS